MGRDGVSILHRLGRVRNSEGFTCEEFVSRKLGCIFTSGKLRVESVFRLWFLFVSFSFVFYSYTYCVFITSVFLLGKTSDVNNIGFSFLVLQ